MINEDKACAQVLPGQNACEDAAAVEIAIRNCVSQFYAKAKEDAVLAPIFARPMDWEDHISRICDFWSRVLLGTTRYNGMPFPTHMALPVEPEHFARWLALFAETARETLPAHYAGVAIERANHMGTCFMAGIFPFKDRDGRPARLPG